MLPDIYSVAARLVCNKGLVKTGRIRRCKCSTWLRYFMTIVKGRQTAEF